MAQLYIDLTISAADALAAGQTRAGVMRVPLTAAILEPLSAEERAELARACTEDEAKGVHYELRLTVRSVSPEGIAAAVRERIAERAAKEAEARAMVERSAAAMAGPVEGRLEYRPEREPGARWDWRREIGGVRFTEADLARCKAEAEARNRQDEADHDARLLDEPPEQHIERGDDGKWVVIESVRRSRWRTSSHCLGYPRAEARAEELAKARNAEREAAQKSEYEAVLREALSAEQWERYEAGVLPTDERDGVVRAHLFAGVDLPVYEKIKRSDVEHDDDCDDTTAVKFSADEVTEAELDADEYARLKAVRSAFAAHARHESTALVLHKGTCRACSGDTLLRYGARVTLRVNGHTYSREYAIT